MSFKNSKSNKAETIEHFITKTIVFKCCLEVNHKAHLEHVIPGTGVFDVFDETTGVIYEIEPRLDKKKQEAKWNQYKCLAGVNDLVIVPYKKIMKDVGELPLNRQTLWKWVKEIRKYIN